MLEKIALQKKFITKAQCSQALEACRDADNLDLALKNYFKKENILTDKRMNVILTTYNALKIIQRNQIFGNCAVDLGLVNEERFLGEITRQKNILSQNKQPEFIGKTWIQNQTLNLDQYQKITRQLKKEQNPQETARPSKPVADPETEQTDQSLNRELDCGVMLEINASGMAAFIRKTGKFKYTVTAAKIIEQLEDNGIVYGLVGSSEVENFIESSGFRVNSFRVARGTDPEPGKDARIEYFFETDHLKAGDIDEDGNIDFKNRGPIPWVKKGSRHGGDGLTPVKKYPEDEHGFPLVPIKRITRFFLEEIEKVQFVTSGQYIEELYELLKALIQDLPAVSFDIGINITQEDIRELDNKTIIELLTTNVIITYFYLVKSNPGNQVESLRINPDIQSIIKQSTAGKVYKHLVSDTQKELFFSLTQDKPWFEYVEKINDADLICRLAGARLPSMEKTSLGVITGKSRQEIAGYNDMFTKLLYMTRFCREFTQNAAFQAPVNDLFQLLFKVLVDKINQVFMEEGDSSAGLGRVESALFEIRRAIEKLDLDESRLTDKKKEVKNAYVTLISIIDFQFLEAVLNLCDMICEVTHDKDREIMIIIRAALMEKSFFTLEEYAGKKISSKDAIPEISKRLQAFAVHYRPQREFYRIFFETYVISKPRPNIPHYTRFLISNRPFAQAMLMRFADYKTMKDFLPESYIEKANRLLDDLLKKTRAAAWNPGIEAL